MFKNITNNHLNMQFKQFFLAPFIFRGKINKPLLIIFFLISGIVLFNAIVHHPCVGYDGKAHLHYIVNVHEILTTFRLPTQGVTKEFFSPPLPYVIPTVFYTLIKRPCEYFALGIDPYSGLEYSLFLTGKFAQLLNVLLSLGLTLYLLKICDLIRPEKITCKIASLALLGMLPVYYKTFAFVRGEPFVALFSVLVAYQLLSMMMGENKGFVFRHSMVLGILIGLLLLSRQWGFLVLPAIALLAAIHLIKQRQKAIYFIKALIISFCIAVLLSGWFYLLLKIKVGHMTAFNRQTSGFSFSNQPVEFYFGLGLKNGAFFKRPTRTAFRNQLLPVFYSETWGDYWSRFSVTGYIPGRGYNWAISNSKEMRPYLGRVNAMSLLPTAILLAGFFVGTLYLVSYVKPGSVGEPRVGMSFSLFVLIVIMAFVGYLWFLINYPYPAKGDTIKATYMLHIFPFLSMLGGEFLYRVKERSLWLYRIVLVGLLIVFLHNIPTLITHYTPLFWEEMY